MTPLVKAYKIAQSFKTPMYKYIKRILNSENSFVQTEMERIKTNVLNSTSTKRTEYLKINPNLRTPTMYLSVLNIPEHYRRAFTRMRLSSHKLKIETGRWARIDKESRVCTCDGVSVQNEEHVTLFCPRTKHARIAYCSCTSLYQHYETHTDFELCKESYGILDSFQA
jgi:hypothetical protein